MRLADFQTPLANATHAQFQQQASQQLQQAQPAAQAQEITRQDIEEDKTVQETEEQEEINPIQEEAERGARRRRLPRRRATPNHGRPPIPTQAGPAPKDGIHGIQIDVQA